MMWWLVVVLFCLLALDIIVKSTPAPGTPTPAPEPRKLHNDSGT
jgi:hypothetical protein